MTLLTVSDLRNHVNTDAPDAALQDLLSAEEAAIARLCGTTTDGSLDSVTENFRFRDFSDKYLVLGHEAESITAIIEDGEALTPEEYEVLDGNRVIARKGWIHDSSYISWGCEVSVTYQPYNDVAQRKRALIYLVKIGLAQNGYDVERNPEFLMDPVDYQRERVRTLRSLQRFPRFA